MVDALNLGACRFTKRLDYRGRRADGSGYDFTNGRGRSIPFQCGMTLGYEFLDVEHVAASLPTGLGLVIGHWLAARDPKPLP